MTQEDRGGKLHIDSDWKEEAAREKQRLAEKEKQEAVAKPAGDSSAGSVGSGFFELINLLAMQAMVQLGGFQGPGGERIPANPSAAKHVIDLLDVLEQKTQGNLTDDERKVLNATLHELRLHYVEMASRATVVPPDLRGSE